MATKRRNGNGYMVIPPGDHYMSLATARKEAKKEAKRGGHSRVESVSTGKTISSYSSNPGKRVRKNTMTIRNAKSVTIKRNSDGTVSVRTVKGKR